MFRGGCHLGHHSDRQKKRVSAGRLSTHTAILSCVCSDRKEQYPEMLIKADGIK